MDEQPDTWTGEGVKGGLIRFYREIAGVGLMFPRADWPVAVEYPGYPVMRLRRIEGIEFVKEAVAALGVSTELAGHLFRECWVVGTDSKVDLCRAFGWEMEAHAFRPDFAPRVHTPWCIQTGFGPRMHHTHRSWSWLPPTWVDVVQAVARWPERRLVMFAIDGDGASGVFDGGRGIG
jgi:hypothetical protein